MANRGEGVASPALAVLQLGIKEPGGVNSHFQPPGLILPRPTPTAAAVVNPLVVHQSMFLGHPLESCRQGSTGGVACCKA